MRYTVTWDPSAEAELMAIWLGAPDRQAVTDAANEIDRLLANDPQLKGQPFYGDRILVASPLAVTFSVSPDDRRVRVLQVWHR